MPMVTKKDKIQVKIIAGEWLVIGDYHYIPGSRITDSLNFKNNDFVAITDAVVYHVLTNQKVMEADFLNINRMNIQLVSPNEELGTDKLEEHL